jgi:hypothetical protein
MRRIAPQFLIGLVVLVLGANPSLSAQSTCFGNGCTLRFGAGTTMLRTEVPAIARVSVNAGRQGQPKVTLFANARMVIQTADGGARDQADTTSSALVQGGGPQVVDAPAGEAGQRALYTITAP